MKNDFFLQNTGHMTKMAATSIYGKNSFSGTGGPILKKLDMKHLGHMFIIVFFSNDDPRLTLTYFTARSKFIK